ncbi:Phosphoglycolate phosphatase [Commensalibacter sp. Nvir]|uniref:HAD family hydrolase n=1 Tax=Commensalibacter sp. Nvir TaxID=3069817 RepID=UPI002D61A8D6|nr:Phosphoglycolate phosphatase [Commensalibacter sp. Nvir]
MKNILKTTLLNAPKAAHPDGKLKLVIFDCDGVLVESEHLVSQVIGHEARIKGWNITDKQAREIFSGVQLRDVQKEIQKHVSNPLPDDWNVKIHEKIVDAMQGDVQQIEGVEDILQTLQKLNLPYRIGSNSSMREMTMKFTKTNLQKWFSKDRIHSAHDVKRSKPFPDLYLYAAEQEGVKPEECFVIEDSDTGLKAAYDAGMVCILLRDLEKPAPNYPGLIRVNSLKEASNFITEVLKSQNNFKR